MVLARSKWNDSTKIWETTEALANAPALVTDLTAIFHGHLDVPVLSLQPTGTYRDDFDSSEMSLTWEPSGTAPSISLYPDSSTASHAYVAEGAALATPGISKLNDRVAHVSPRHRSESFGVWLFVCTGGHVCHVPTGEDLAVVVDTDV